MPRQDYYKDPDAPRANRIVPATSAVIADDNGSILLIKRSDNGLWSIPGGTMEPGEDIASCCIREVKEETGFTIQLGRLIGLYSDPNHVAAYDDGEVRQEFSICFVGKVVDGQLATSSESEEVTFVPVTDLDDLDIHPSIRLRINDFLARASDPYIR